jgi:hypothetical protein
MTAAGLCLWSPRKNLLMNGKPQFVAFAAVLHEGIRFGIVGNGQHEPAPVLPILDFWKAQWDAGQ